MKLGFYTYGYHDFCGPGGWRHSATLTVGATFVDLLEAKRHRVLSVRYSVSKDGIGQLIDNVKERLVTLNSKCSMSRAAAWWNSQRLDSCYGKGT